MIDLLHEDVQPEPHNKNSDNINKAQDSDIIKSLGNGICGFKMDNVSKTTTPKWTLTVVDKKGKSYNTSTLVFIQGKLPMIFEMRKLLYDYRRLA